MCVWMIDHIGDVRKTKSRNLNVTAGRFQLSRKVTRGLTHGCPNLTTGPRSPNCKAVSVAHYLHQPTNKLRSKRSHLCYCRLSHLCYCRLSAVQGGCSRPAAYCPACSDRGVLMFWHWTCAAMQLPISTSLLQVHTASSNLFVFRVPCLIAVRGVH